VSLLTLAVAVGLHWAWDIAAFAAADSFRLQSKLLAWHTWIPVSLMFGGMALYRWLAKLGARLVRAHLQVCDLHTRECPTESASPAHDATRGDST
jgi:hypothetical protein